MKIDLSGVGLDCRGDLVTQPGGVAAPYLHALAAELARRRERKVFDALELSVALASPELADFEPIVAWACGSSLSTAN